MKKYYVADVNKTKFAYISTWPTWCVGDGRTKLVSGVSKPHFFTLDRAKRTMAQLKKYNETEYQIFETEINT